MTDKHNFAENLFEQAEEFGKTSLELIRLKAVDKTTGFMSSLISGFLVVLTIMIFIIMLSVAIAFLLGETFAGPWSGFIIVAAFYGLAALLIYMLRKSVKSAIADYIVKIAMD
jgi:hypothetical protein